MADLNKNYNKILSDIQERIDNPKDFEYIKGKFSELIVMFMDTIDKLVENNENQLRIEKKVSELQKSMKRIEQDIYIDEDEEDDDDENHDCECGDECEFCSDKMHDNDYEFEIACPYCGYEFVTGKDANLKDEIECPNCHNVIELDWDDYCDGECDECKEHCYEEDDEEESKDSILKVKQPQEKEEEYKHNSGNLDVQNKNVNNNQNDSKNINQNNKINNENEDDM